MTTTILTAAGCAQNCGTCAAWHPLGDCATTRRIIYDNRHLEIPPGEEGQCRCGPPMSDNRWPMTMGRDWCRSWRAREVQPETSETLSAGHGAAREGVKPTRRKSA